MTPLKKLLELYKSMLYQKEVEEVEPIEVEVKPIMAEDFKDNTCVLEDPSPGDVVEIVPSYDNLEMTFLVLREINGFYEVVPMSPFYQFASPRDVLVLVEGRPYIVQTELSFDVPKKDFTRRFGNATLFKVGEVGRETLERVKRVARGEEEGDGGMVGEVKEEFKRLEAKRWFAVFTSQIAEEEALQELSTLLEELKSELPLSASEQEGVRGRVEGLEWFYDEIDEVLVILPEDELVGKKKKVVLEVEGEEITLFEGELPSKIELPLRKEAYSYTLLERGLKLKDA